MHSTQALADLDARDETPRKIAVGCGGCFASILFVLLGLSLGTGFLITTIDRPLISLLSAFLAVLICVPYALFFIWLDRNEREPLGLLGLAFFWGAVLAIGISGFVNSSFMELTAIVTQNPQLAFQATASISAPFIEEITKMLAVLVIFLAFPRHFDNVLDGIIYGAMAGLGFAMIENYTYYVRQPTVNDVFIVFWIRGIVAAIGSHAIYSAIAGGGLGLFRVMRRGALRWFIPPACLALAMAVHFGWNTFAGLFVTGATSGIEVLYIRYPLATIILHVPFTLGVLVIVGVVLRHEYKLIREHLETEDPTVVHPGELETLVPAWRRSLVSLKLALNGDLKTWSLRRKRDAALVRLAFEKWHMRREADLDNTDKAQQHAVTVLALRTELTTNLQMPNSSA